jgi:hypothetical protein
MRYQPKYAKGQILVGFRGDHSEAFAREFGHVLGYKLIDEWDHDSNAYVYSVPENKEDTACKSFALYTEFVAYAMLRDMKLESRWQSLEQAIEMMTELTDDCEIPDSQYTSRYP